MNDNVTITLPYGTYSGASLKMGNVLSDGTIFNPATIVAESKSFGDLSCSPFIGEPHKKDILFMLYNKDKIRSEILVRLR